MRGVCENVRNSQHECVVGSQEENDEKNQVTLLLTALHIVLYSARHPISCRGRVGLHGGRWEIQAILTVFALDPDFLQSARSHRNRGRLRQCCQDRGPRDEVSVLQM